MFMKSTYERLSAISFLSKSYTFKFLFIAFLGIHVPLVGLVVFILFKPDVLTAFSVLGLTLVLTLGATAVTLFILNGLLSPLRRSKDSLSNYRLNRQLPQLPVRFEDEAGLLMQNIQFTLTELDDLLEEKKDLTSLLSHDLRIPIRNVKTFAAILLEKPDAETAEDVAKTIIQSADEQSKLVDNILDMLRQEHLFFSGSEWTEIDPSALFDTIIASFAKLAKEKNVSLEKQISYHSTLKVQPELFTQVLKNLVSNAIKFSHPGDAVIISLGQKKGRLEISVKDTGIGFNQEIAESLFERFTKNGRPGTAGEPSTGIGLYLSRKIVRYQRGELSAYSEGPGKGSEFCIALN